MTKKLKVWNGRSFGKYARGSINVAAYNQAHAAELIVQALYPDIVNPGQHWINAREIRLYYAPCWGNDMKGIEPSEPCVYLHIDGELKKLL